MGNIDQNQRKFILASGSPRRKELTASIGLEPIVIKSDAEEVRADGESALDYTIRLARDKALAVAEAVAGRDDLPDWILAADTIVVLDGDILEKPVDREDAIAMLRALSGSTHEVITSYCWLRRGEEPRAHAVTTEVIFRELDLATIERYVDTGEPMDKAGAYGIQGLGGVFVQSIQGSFTAVVGLPIAAVVDTLRDAGGLTDFPFIPEG